MQITNRANLPAESFAEVQRELPLCGTLQQAVVWGARQQPPVLLLETVAQDEYTHDVIAGDRNASAGLFFVFGST